MTPTIVVCIAVVVAVVVFVSIMFVGFVLARRRKAS
jgi:hypothetical protein